MNSSKKDLKTEALTEHLQTFKKESFVAIVNG